MEKQNKRVAVLGGAFDPPTRAHLTLARFLLSQQVADEIWFMPAYQHPFAKQMQDYSHRVSMCQSMCQGEKGLWVSSAESQIASYSQGRTWELLQFLSAEQKDCEFLFVMGQDNADGIERWYRWQDLLANYRIIVLPRAWPGPVNLKSWYRSAPHVFFEHMPTMAVSSTAVRAALGAGSKCTEDLDPKVWNYICQHKLYF